MARHDRARAARRALMRASGIALAAGALVAAAAGCDPLADEDYPGEPLLVLRGQVEGTAPLAPVEAAMLWQRGPPPSTDDLELATRAPVESGFPATFTMRLYQPPPPAARRTLAPGEVSFARGNAAALPLGITADAVPAQLATANPSYGLDVDHWVIHLDADVPPRTLTAWWLGAALPAGYHLLRVKAVNPACRADVDACVATLVDLGVSDAGEGPGTARWFCLAPYRLSPAPPGDLVVLPIGTYDLPPPGSCP